MNKPVETERKYQFSTVSGQVTFLQNREVKDHDHWSVELGCCWMRSADLVNHLRRTADQLQELARINSPGASQHSTRAAQAQQQPQSKGTSRD